MAAPNLSDYPDFGSPGGAGTITVDAEAVPVSGAFSTAQLDVSQYSTVAIIFAPTGGTPTTYQIQVKFTTLTPAGATLLTNSWTVTMLAADTFAITTPVRGQLLQLTFTAAGGSATIGGSLVIQGSNQVAGCLQPGLLATINSQAFGANASVTVDAGIVLNGLATITMQTAGTGLAICYIQILDSGGAFRTAAGVNVPNGSAIGSFSFNLPPAHVRLAITNGGTPQSLEGRIMVA